MNLQVLGSAKRRGVEARKANAFGRQPINIGRANVGRALDAEIAPALVVGEDNDKIGLFLFCRGRGECQEEGRGECQEEGRGECQEEGRGWESSESLRHGGMPDGSGRRGSGARDGWVRLARRLRSGLSCCVMNCVHDYSRGSVWVSGSSGGVRASRASKISPRLVNLTRGR